MTRHSIRLLCSSVLAVMLVAGCIGGRSAIGRPDADRSPAVMDGSDTNAQQGLLNVVAELRAEVNAMKVQSGRDTYSGLTVQNEMSAMLAVLLAIVVLSQTAEAVFDRWCEYRVEMRKP